MAAVIQSVRHIAALANTVRWVLGRVKTIGAFTSKGEQGRDNDIYSRTDGALGLIYEAGDYEAIIFVRIEPGELGELGGAVSLVARPGSSGAAKPPEVAVPGR